MNGVCCAGTGTNLETAASTPKRGIMGDREGAGGSRETHGCTW